MSGPITIATDPRHLLGALRGQLPSPCSCARHNYQESSTPPDIHPVDSCGMWHRAGAPAARPSFSSLSSPHGFNRVRALCLLRSHGFIPMSRMGNWRLRLRTRNTWACRPTARITHILAKRDYPCYPVSPPPNSKSTLSCSHLEPRFLAAHVSPVLEMPLPRSSSGLESVLDSRGSPIIRSITAPDETATKKSQSFVECYRKEG